MKNPIKPMTAEDLDTLGWRFFWGGTPDERVLPELAKSANSYIEKEWERLVSEGSPVFAIQHEDEGDEQHLWWGKSNRSMSTHQALLINIQPIERECAHEIYGRIGTKNAQWNAGGTTHYSNGLIDPTAYVCRLCGKEFKPTGWEPA